MAKRAFIFFLCAALLMPAGALSMILVEGDDMPDGFTYVTDLIPDALLDIRYAGTHNFVGDVIDGYEAGVAILTDKAAKALAAAAMEFREAGYLILIYDAYRPYRAVKHFVRWSEDESDLRMQAEFYPEFSSKKRIVDLGYIARRSSHSRGSALDMTLTDLDGNPLDMGTCFDYFGEKAAHGAKGLTDTQVANRALLKSVMQKHGFRSFAKEWWHYTLKNEPYPDKYFDFIVR